MEGMHMKARWIPLLIVTTVVGGALTVAGCATTPGTASAGDTGPAAVSSAPFVRLLNITPADGVQVDSTTVIELTVAYHIPDFDLDRSYRLSAMFAGADGGVFSRRQNSGQLLSPAGVVTVRQPVEALWSGGGNSPATPLTGAVFLFESHPEPLAADTVQQGERMLVRTSGVSRVRAQTRTFHFNGAGPARNLGGGLPHLLESYWTFRSHKAFAVAFESANRWTYGYAFGFSSPDDAVERALEECRSSAERRGIDASCEVMMVDGDPAEPVAGGSPGS